MPVSRLGERITTALQDRKITSQDVSDLISTAKAEKKFTPELKAELTSLLSAHGDKFDSSAKAQLNQFLATTTATRDLADPSVLTKHTTSVAWNPVAPGGKLYVDDVNYDDVVQGSIANCYMVSAFSAIAQQNPKAIKDAIKDNGDGTFSVRFFEKSGYGFKAVTVTVDSDIAADAGASKSKYGKAREGGEQWVSVLEKAYAQWKGGFETIGNGGHSTEVFEALTGKRSTWENTTGANTDRLFKTISTNVAAHKPMTAGTFGEDSGVNYTGTGVYAWHAYTLLGASEENGQKYVQLRNPWGSHEPGADGKNDGIFKMKMEDFVKLYSTVNIGG